MIVAGLIKYLKQGGENLSDMQGHVKLLGWAIIEPLLYLNFKDKNRKIES